MQRIFNILGRLVLLARQSVSKAFTKCLKGILHVVIMDSSNAFLEGHQCFYLVLGAMNVLTRGLTGMKRYF